MLYLQLSQTLCSGQCRLELVDTSIEVVLGLVEHWICLQNLEDGFLTLQGFLCEEEVGEFLDGNI